MKKKFLTNLTILTFLLPVFTLAQKGQGKNFYSISQDMNNYYNQVGKSKFGYKQFKRWEWYYSTRLGAGGNLTDNNRLNKEANEIVRARSNNNNGGPLANTGLWTSVGPTFVSSENRGIGRVNRLAFHPTDANTIYAATASGGLWRTTNNGDNWFPFTDGIPNMCLSGVVVHPGNANIIYILTGDGDATFGGAWGQFRYTKYSTGVLKSFDGGFTWYQTALNWPETDAHIAYKLVIHPTNPEILLAATNDGLWRTTNGGNSWTQLQTGIWFWDIEFQPGNPSTIYACGNSATESRVYTSTDDGATFTETEDFPLFSDDFNRTALAVTPASPNNVYLLAGPTTGTGSFRGFYRSTDAGQTFTLRTSTPNILGRSSTGNDNVDQERYDLCTAVSPTNANIVVTGGIRVWTSANAGTSFAYQDNYVDGSNYYHDDVHDLIYHPLRSNELYMAADGGVYKSTNNGDTWVYLHDNMQVTQYYKFSINTTTGLGNENIIIGGTQDNGTNKRDAGGGSNFSQITGADGMDCFIDPDNTNVYVSSIQDGKFYYSLVAGASFEEVGDPAFIGATLGISVTGNWVTPVAEITGNSTQFVIGYDPVVKVTRIGTNVYTFDDIGGPVGGKISGLSFIKTARGNANRIYAGDNLRWGDDDNAVWTTTNGGTSWTNIFFENDHGGIPVTDLSFNPDNGNEIWLTFGGYSANKKVWYSGDGGSNWTNITGSLPNVPINCIVYDDNNGSPDDALYIGTDIGVFYRDNNLGDWIPYRNGLPVVEVTDIEIHESGGFIRCATYGRGIWQSSLYNACVSNVVLSTLNTVYYMPYYFQAGTSINSEAWHFGTGANVFYKAATEVILAPGFHSSGNIFEAAIGPCGGGVPSRVVQIDSATIQMNQLPDRRTDKKEEQKK